MTEQLVRSDQLLTPNQLGLVNDRKTRANLHGPEDERLAFLILQLDPNWQQPPGSNTLPELRRVYQEKLSQQTHKGDTRSDRLTARWHEIWNKYVVLLPIARRLGLPSERQIEPIAHSHTAAQVEELQRVHDELSHEISIAESTTPQERRSRLLETRMDQHDGAVKLIFAKLREVVDLVNTLEQTVQGMKRPNAIAAGARLVVSNNGDAA
jgi:hypothetical protein